MRLRDRLLSIALDRPRLKSGDGGLRTRFIERLYTQVMAASNAAMLAAVRLAFAALEREAPATALMTVGDHFRPIHSRAPSLLDLTASRTTSHSQVSFDEAGAIEQVTPDDQRWRLMISDGA